MISKFIEATNGFNWGKFMVARFSPEEWAVSSQVDAGKPLLRSIGMGDYNIMVMDLQTKEGAIFRHGGMAKADLEKHRVWVCPMFEPFLEWLYKQDVSDILKLPDKVDLKAESALSGYRRKGVRRMTILDQLDTFLADNQARRIAVSWLHDDDIKVYIRKNRRHIGETNYECLDIASVEVYQQGQGTFTEFLEQAEEANPFPLLFIENVLEERFAAFFEKRGWTKYFPPGGEDGPPSFYKLQVAKEAV